MPIVFTTLAMFQVYNALNCRSRTQSVFKIKFFGNPYLLAGIAGSILLQIGAIYLPFMQQALETTPPYFGKLGPDRPGDQQHRRCR